MRWPRAASLGVGLFVIGCGGSSFSAADAGSDSSSQDGGGDRGVDSMADQSMVDAGDATVRDGPIEVGPDAVLTDAGKTEAGLGWCATNHPGAYCDDFDEWDADLSMDPTGWRISSTNGASVHISPLMSSSPPDSLWTATSSMAGSNASVSLPMTTAPGVVRVGFAIYLSGSEGCFMTAGGIGMAEVFFPGAAIGSYTVSLDLIPQMGGAPTASVEETAGGTTSHPLTDAIALNTWTKVTLDLAFPGPGQASATVTIANTHTIMLSPPIGYPTPSGHVGVGVRTVANCGAYFDNVTIDIQ